MISLSLITKGNSNMPGSIRVTVLEAFDLPARAADGKYVSVKVSIGKREFQTKPNKVDGSKTTTWNSEFVFPVLNLRDNLVVVLLGSKGEDLSRNEIDTSSIVEKAFRDEALLLKGGGCIHLKLNFVLTEEERRRIEVMRAAAVRRREKETSKLSGKNQSEVDIGESPAVLMPTITGKEIDKDHVLDGVAPRLETLGISSQSEAVETLNALKESNLGCEVKEKAEELNPPNLNPSEVVARYVEETPTSEMTLNANEASAKDLTRLHGESQVVAEKAAKAKVADATQCEDGDIVGAAGALSIQEEGTLTDRKSLDFDPWSSQGSIGGSISPTPLIHVPDEAAHSENMTPLDLDGMGSNLLSLDANDENLTCSDPVAAEKPIEPEPCLASGFKDETTQPFVDAPQTSGITTSTSSSVKAKIKAYEKSYSQDAGYINQMLPTEGGKLQVNIHLQWKENAPHSSLKEQAKPLDKEEDASNILRGGKEDGTSFGLVGHVELATDGGMDSKEVRSKVIEERGADRNPAEQLLILSTVECLDDAGRTESDAVLEACAEESEGEEYTPCLREQEKEKKLNSLGLLGFTKRVLGGAVIVAAGIVLWAANSNRRSSTLQRSRSK